MTKDQCTTILGQIENLSAFARLSKIPLRTLQRLKAGAHAPQGKTAHRLMGALRRYYPDKVPAARADTSLVQDLQQG